MACTTRTRYEVTPKRLHLFVSECLLLSVLFAQGLVNLVLDKETRLPGQLSSVSLDKVRERGARQENCVYRAGARARLWPCVPKGGVGG